MQNERSNNDTMQDDWTKVTEPIPTQRELWRKRRILAAKRTLDFILEHPEGVTREDFDKAGIPIRGIERLTSMKLIKGTQIKEPERGPRAYHWLWKPNTKGAT
jgi:hypothetical protein